MLNYASICFVFRDLQSSQETQNPPRATSWGVRPPLPAPPVLSISFLFLYYLSSRCYPAARRGVPRFRYKNGYSAHPVRFEGFRYSIVFLDDAEMCSVSPIYARLQNAQRIIHPRAIHSMWRTRAPTREF